MASFVLLFLVDFFSDEKSVLFVLSFLEPERSYKESICGHIPSGFWDFMYQSVVNFEGILRIKNILVEYICSYDNEVTA